ncbi:hypothetical protein BU23DRAFT_25044 [Bimuria novae-zelandiae CBS 107.79]|uniref:Apple domain-containing protein n=1 Tax=Bimuria novae-zelandiae CBS 107.79 TaxID=1447943 RepID=A0A6A5UKT2_9PLEO|nr:hypothetical protein BU23DRAFT_25044 [Bimuria novae-zelandiae CBS 107.79]
MSGCSLVANELVAQINGQIPVFQYTKSHADGFFGIQMTYLRTASTCYSSLYGTPAFTPVIQNTAAGYTKTCRFLTAPLYTGIFCTAAPLSAIPDGPLTVTFRGFTGPAATAPIPFTASFGPSPGPVTSTVTARVTQRITQTSIVAGGYASTSTVNGGFAATTTAPGGPSSTVTVYAPNTTITSINTVNGTTTATTTKTNTVSSCPSSSAPVIVPSSSPVAPSAAFPSCPQDDGRPFSTSSGDFIIECGIDRYDNDIGVAYGRRTFAECIDACALVPACVDVSYNGDCYLKSGIGAPNKNSAVWGARMASPPASIPSTTEAPATSAPATPIYPQTITVTTTVASMPYNYQGTAAPVANPRCPTDDQATYVSSCGAQYVIECAVDRYGADLPNGFSYESSLADCINDCDKTAGCVDVSWIVTGSCYKKGSIAPIRKNQDIFGARQISGCTNSPKLKLHRKRVVRNELPKAPLEKLEKKFSKLQKRGIAYGPDVTWTTGTATVTSMDTSLSTVTVTTTAAPSGVTTITLAPAGITTTTNAPSGITTTTSYTASTTVVNTTNYVTSTATVLAPAVTMCPA